MFNVIYVNRDQLLRNYNLRDYTLEVDIQDLRSFDEALCDKLVKQPSEFLPLVSIQYLKLTHEAKMHLICQTLTYIMYFHLSKCQMILLNY